MRAGIAILAAGGLGVGCSSFQQDWRHAANPSPGSNPTEGRWQGRWISSANGHQGRLRCVLTRLEADRYRARYHANYLKILSFHYTAELRVEAKAEGYAFKGSADLGRLAGGVYAYEGTIVSNRFYSTYKSKYDHGNFEMKRGP